MQLTLFDDECSDLMLRIHRRLLQTYGTPGPFLLLDPVSQLVMGLIGGKTRGAVSKAAFTRLRRRFRTWDAVQDAPIPEIHQNIVPVTYAEKKAPRLKRSLQIVTASQGRISLDLLDAMSVNRALAWLERLPGIGRKTSALILNFSTLRKRTLVIDTHHLRVLRRIGLTRSQATITEAYDQLMPLLPDALPAGVLDVHHQLMKTHGQRVCHASWPACGICPLSDLCTSQPETTGF